MRTSNCPSNAYFNAHPNSTATPSLNVAVDLGDVMEDPPPNPPRHDPSRRAGPSNVSVTYRLVRRRRLDILRLRRQLRPQAPNPDATGTVTYSTRARRLAAHAAQRRTREGNAVAIQIRVKGSTVVPNPVTVAPARAASATTAAGSTLGTGISARASRRPKRKSSRRPIQRSFMGRHDSAGSVRVAATDDRAELRRQPRTTSYTRPRASRPVANRCFFVDLGLKGGIARIRTRSQFSFNEGIGASQMGAVDCDPNIQQGQILEDGVIKGCEPGTRPTASTPSRSARPRTSIFDLPNPARPGTTGPRSNASRRDRRAR